jgi:2C-methyl-D-erythritol 2,4-cyclodiphosphate synthase
VLERIRHVIPGWAEKQVTSIAAPNGGQSGRSGAITIDDVMLHARMLAGSLGVDLAMIGFADQLHGGLGEGGFFRMSAHAAESARKIRGAVLDALHHICDIHTLKKHGVVFPPSERPWELTLYGSISALEKERAATLNDGGAYASVAVQVIQQIKEIGADKESAETFLKNIMKLDEDEAEVFAKWVEAKAPDDGMGGMGGMGGDPGGGPAELGEPNPAGPARGGDDDDE